MKYKLMNKLWKHDANQNKQENIIRSHLKVISRTGKLIETESRSEVTKGWGKEKMGSYCFVVTVSVWDDEKVLEREVVMAVQHCEDN